MRVGERADAPRDRGQCEECAGRDCHERSARQLADEHDRQPGRHAQRHRGEQVHPHRGLTDRRQQQVCEPAQQDVARVARGMGRAQHGGHDLELAGVPQAQAGEQRRSRDRECDQANQRGRDAARECAPATAQVPRLGAAHQPSVRAHAIPQTWSATEAAIRPPTRRPPRAAPRPWRATSRSAPSATGTRRNGAKSRLNR